MKKLEFETSKGKFLVIDAVEKPNIHTGIKLSEITEEQASEIVGIEINMNHSANHNIMQLHSLLKSKGIHLFKNPYTKSTDLNSSFFSMQTDFNKEKEAEQKTFYNPYIFKI